MHTHACAHVLIVLVAQWWWWWWWYGGGGGSTAVSVVVVVQRHCHHFDGMGCATMPSSSLTWGCSGGGGGTALLWRSDMHNCARRVLAERVGL